LGEGRGDLLPGNAPITEAAPTENAPARPYRIAKTRKGGLPVTVEKRARGKVVTVVRNISGDGASLLKDLKRRCGAAGVVREDSIEIQGDHRGKVEAYLKEAMRP
jgi:translation initiation factor 1 (eIF-1/SUI1)